MCEACPVKRVHIARNPVEAQLVVDLLIQEGIPAVIRGDALFNTVEGGAAALGMLPTVWIQHDVHLERAQHLVERYERGDLSDQGRSWTCPRCGERHDPPFAVCWRCGAQQPD